MNVQLSISCTYVATNLQSLFVVQKFSSQNDLLEMAMQVKQAPALATFSLQHHHKYNTFCIKP